MIRVSIKENEDINRALKRFKKKFEKAQVIKDYRSNTFYTKKSVSLREEKLKKYNFTKNIFLPNGTSPKFSQIFKNIPLANSLNKISKMGAKAFYEGEIARDIIDYCYPNAKKIELFARRKLLKENWSYWGNEV